VFRKNVSNIPAGVQYANNLTREILRNNHRSAVTIVLITPERALGREATNSIDQRFIENIAVYLRKKHAPKIHS